MFLKLIAVSLTNLRQLAGVAWLWEKGVGPMGYMTTDSKWEAPNDPSHI